MPAGASLVGRSRPPYGRLPEHQTFVRYFARRRSAAGWKAMRE